MIKTGGALASASVLAPAGPMIGVGEVRHARLRPAAHRFAYPTYFLMLPMRRLRSAPSSALTRNRFGLITFHDRDHGDGRADSLAWLDQQLAEAAITDADGEVWLHCYPRVLGFAFKPVSFWHCHRADGSLAAVLVEVNNTFGERHCYLLSGPSVAFGRELRADKVFHVSPFCAVTGDYRFRFMTTGLHPIVPPGRIEPASAGFPGVPGTMSRTTPRHTLRKTPRTIARIDHHDAEGLLIQTSVSGELRPLTGARIRAAFFGMPLMTFGVIARIHWQALRLWLKRVPFFPKPEPPVDFVTRQSTARQSTAFQITARQLTAATEHPSP